MKKKNNSKHQIIDCGVGSKSYLMFGYKLSVEVEFDIRSERGYKIKSALNLLQKFDAASLWRHR